MLIYGENQLMYTIKIKLLNLIIKEVIEIKIVNKMIVKE